MPEPSAPTTAADAATTGELIGRLGDQLTTLVRDELQLARVELTAKGKAAGIGVGLFGGAGLFALYGLGVLIAAGVLGLATVVDAWLAALIVAVVLFAVAGVAALVGKKEVTQATPPMPTEAVDGLKQDTQALKGNHPGSATGPATTEGAKR